MKCGPFVLQRFIDRGGMGAVWKGVHQTEEVPVAVKFVVTRQINEEQRAMLLREVRSQARLQHPGIVRVLDFGELDHDLSSEIPEGTPYMVMPYIEGGTLEDLVGEMKWPEIRQMLLALLDALAFGHARGLVHRDIKPANILVASEGRGVTYKLADFGIAYAVDRKDEEQPDMVDSLMVGTPAYMAPEQLHGQWRQFGPWTDLYAVGAVTWELVTGEQLYQKGSPVATALAHAKEPLPEFVPAIDVPDGLHRWLQRLLEKKPSDRFRQAADAAWALVQSELPFERSSQKLYPPMQTSWKSPRPPEYSLGLIGAGLSLFDLREVPLIGREKERNMLWETLARTRDDSRARAVVIEGPSGTGKTRLARWLGRRADELGAAWPLRALHTPEDSSGAGLADMFETYFRSWKLTRRETWETIFDRLEEMGEDDTARNAEDAKGITEVILGSASDDEDDAMWHFQNPDEKFRLIARVLRKIARGRPLVIGVDDVQWGLETLAFMKYVLIREPETPVVFVVTTRTDVDFGKFAQQVLGDVEQTAVIELAPLNADKHRQLIHEMLPLAPELLEEVARKTEGNPLFARQLIGDWSQSGKLVSSPQGFRLKSRDVTIPNVINDLWLTRLERMLSDFPDERSEWDNLRAIEAAAALGREVDKSEWLAVCDELGLQPSAGLGEALISRGLATASHSGWRFAHSMLVGSIVDNCKGTGRWIEANLACAKVLRSDYVNDVATVANRLVTHFKRAERFEQAADYAEIAWRRAKERGVADEGSRLLDEWEDLLERARVSPQDPRWAYYRLAKAQSVFGDRGAPAEAVEIIEDVERSLPDGAYPQVRVEVHQLKGLYLGIMRRFDEALAELERAREALRQTTGMVDMRRLARLLDINGWILTRLGRYDEAVERYQEVLALDIGDSRAGSSLSAELGLAGIYLAREEYDRARAHAEAIAREAKRTGRSGWQVDAMSIIAESYKFRGDWQNAIQAGKAVVEFAEVHQAAYTSRASRLNLAMSQIGAGRFEDAMELFGQSIDQLAEEGLQDFVPFMLVGRATCAACQGDWELFDQSIASLARVSKPADTEFKWFAELASSQVERHSDKSRARALGTAIWEQ